MDARAPPSPNGPNMIFPRQTLTQYVSEHWPAYGDKPALIDAATGRAVTYAQLHAGVQAVAANLVARGLRPGDVFSLFSPNVPEYPIASLGIQLAGGIPTTANPVYTAEELHHQLTDSGATRLLTVPAFLDKAREAAAGTAVNEIWVFGEAPGALPFANLMAPAPPAPAHQPDLDDVIALPYSSGTTGIAKGVMLTHRSMVAALCQIVEMEQTHYDDVTIAFLPFFHIYGMQAICNAGLRQGSTLIVMSRFDFEGFLKAIETYRVSRLYIVPPIVLALSKSPLVENYDLSSLRTALTGAAPVGAAIAQACAARLGVPIRQGYGMTETSCIITIAPPGLTPPQPDSVGLPTPGSEVKLVDGELWVRGPQIMKGYWKRPDATADMLLPGGWLRTGDIAEIDDNGWIRVVDRCKELIKYKGSQVPPAELEALLVSHPAVLDAAVIGVPDDEAGEIPKAFVVLRGPATSEELSEFVAAHVAPFKKIRQWAFVDHIPKSPSGKILRRLLRS